MSAASLASLLITKLSNPEERTGDAGDMTGRGQASTPRLTTVWRPKSIPYDIPDVNHTFRSEGSLLRLLRSKSMPLLGREGSTTPGRIIGPPGSHSPARSESLSPVRQAAGHGATTQSSGHLSDASESTVPSLATPPPTPRSPSPSGQRRSRSQSDGHLWQRRKRQVRRATEPSTVGLPSVRNLRGKFENKNMSAQGNEQPAGPGESDGEAAEQGPEVSMAPERRLLRRHNSLLRSEPKSPERLQAPKPAVTAASVRKRLQQVKDSPKDVYETTEVLLMNDEQELHEKSHIRGSLKTTASDASHGHELRRRTSVPSRMRPKNHRRSKSEPDPASVLRLHAQSSPPSVKKLKMLFERESVPDSSREPPPLSPRKMLRETTPDPPQSQRVTRKPPQEVTVEDTDGAEVVHLGVTDTTVPSKTPPMEQVNPVLAAGTPSVRSLRWRFEAGTSGQSLKATEETNTKPRRSVGQTLKTPFEGAQPRQARSVSPEKDRRGSLTRLTSASVKNLLRQFEALSPEEALRGATGDQAVDERSRRSPIKDSPRKLHPPQDAEDEDKIAPKAEDSKRRLLRQLRTSGSSSSSSSDEEERKDDKRREKELERKRKEEEEAKEKQRIEQEQREKTKRMEEEKAEKERIAREKERIVKEELERKERERVEKERQARSEEAERMRAATKLLEEQRLEEKRKIREREEQERRANEEAERKKAQETLEKQRKEKEEKERKEREMKERKDGEEKEIKERDEKERKERDQWERKEREEKLKKQREEKERKEREERERKDREEKERKEREEKERKERKEREEKERKERKEREEKETKEREEKERKEREEKERKEREEKARKERERAEEEKKNYEKAEQERRTREETERKKVQEEEERRKQREREEAERLQKEKLEAEKRRQEEKRMEEKRREEAKRREEEKKRREELIRRLSSEEMPKEVKIVETRKKCKSESQSSDSDDGKDAKERPNERKVLAMVGHFTQQGRREASPPRDATSPPGEEHGVDRLIDQFTNLKDVDLEGEARRAKVSLDVAVDGDEDEDGENRRTSDVATLVQKFRKMNARRQSSSLSSDSDSGRASPEKSKKEVAPIPTIPTRTNVPGTVRTLRADELRFFETSVGEGGTEPFMRTQSLRGKKSEPSSFETPRFGSLRGNKTRVAVLSTSSATNAALPKNCRSLRTDELRFFTGEVTNIYRSRAAKGRGGKTTRGEGRPPAAPQDNTLPDSEKFFRLAGRGGLAHEANGRSAPSEDDSDSEPSVLRGGDEPTDSEGELYELDITLRSENDTDDHSDTEQHDLDNPMSLLVHSIQGKLLHPVDAAGASDEDTRCYVVFSPGGYLTSSDDEDDDLAAKYPLASPTFRENVTTPTLKENRGAPVVMLDEEPRPAAPGKTLLPDASIRTSGASTVTLTHTKHEDNTAQHLKSTETKTVQIAKTSSQTTATRHTENGGIIDHGETKAAGRPLIELDNLLLMEPKTDTRTEDHRKSRPVLTRGKGVEETDSSEEEEEEKRRRKENEKGIYTLDMKMEVTVNKKDVTLTREVKKETEVMVQKEAKEEKDNIAREVVIVKQEAQKEQRAERVVVMNDEINIIKTGKDDLQDRKEAKMEMKFKKHEKEEGKGEMKEMTHIKQEKEKRKERKKTDKKQEKMEAGKEKQVKEEAVVAKKEASTLKTKQHRPRVDPDEKVDEEALSSFLDELDKLNSLPRIIKPPPRRENPKAHMNAEDSSSEDSSSEDEGLSTDRLNCLEEQIIPLASFQGLSASPGSPLGTLKNVKDSRSLLKDSNTLHEVMEDLVSVAPPSGTQSTKKKKECKEGYHTSPPLLKHFMRQEEEEKTVKEGIQQTYTSPPLPQTLERKEKEKETGRGTTAQRGEAGSPSPQEENMDIISGREFIKFCIFSFWFSVLMYFAKDLLS